MQNNNTVDEKDTPEKNQPPQAPPPPITPYTTLTPRHRTLLTYLLGYLTLASSLTASIYLPLLDLLATRYAVSQQAINLTITLYFVLQAATPPLWSPLSDTLGRRPVFLATFALYTAASLALALVDRSYPALLLLRALQSAGGSAVLALAYAVVADVTVHAERGRVLAPMLAATNLGPCVGPVVGGAAVVKGGDPRGCFGVLAGFGVSGVLLVGFGLPETARGVVGNGGVRARGVWRTWGAVLRERSGVKAATGGGDGVGGLSRGEDPSALERQAQQADTAQEEDGGDASPPSTPNRASPTGRGILTIPNPLPSLLLLLHPDTALTLWLAGCPYALWFCIQTSITPVFTHIYSFNPLAVGCSFLAGGVGVILGGFVAGRLMDANYAHVARKAGFVVDRVRGDDVGKFPIEAARSRWSVTIILLSLGVVVGYGWVVERGVHPAVPLLFQAYIGCKCTVLLQTYSALVVDVFPDRPGTAAASNNITRCTLAAAGVAVMDPLVRALGYGWVFTLLGLFDAVTSVLSVLMLRRWGPGWRAQRTREREVV